MQPVLDAMERRLPGVNNSALAHHLGVSRETILRWKSGSDPTISLSLADEVCCRLGTHLAIVFGDEYLNLRPLKAKTVLSEDRRARRAFRIRRGFDPPRHHELVAYPLEDPDATHPDRQACA